MSALPVPQDMVLWETTATGSSVPRVVAVHRAWGRTYTEVLPVAAPVPRRHTGQMSARAPPKACRERTSEVERMDKSTLVPATSSAIELVDRVQRPQSSKIQPPIQLVFDNFAGTRVTYLAPTRRTAF
jgi:hypothetical protein